MGVLHQLLRTRLGLTALLSVCALLCVALFQTHALARSNASALTFTASSTAPAAQDGDLAQELLLLGLTTSSSPNASSTNDSIAMIGPVVVAQLAGSYAGLEDTNSLTQNSLTQSAEHIAENIRAALTYKTYTVADIRTSSDTSYQAMLGYRAAMRDALAPLLQNSQNELDLYAKYVETSDPSYLDTLAAAAQNYRAAVSAAAAITVPRDAVNYHKDVLNALEKFTAVIESIKAHQGDTLAEAALLRNYNDAEAGVYTAFNALSSYYSQKKP